MAAPPPPPPPPPPPEEGAALIVKVRATEVAAEYLLLPAWLAVTVQSPVATKLMVAELAVQTFDGEAAKVTAKPELEVAETLRGPGNC